MKVEFSLPIKAFSLNQYRYGHSPHKTKAARDYEDGVLERLKGFPPLLYMADTWRSEYGTLEVDFVFVYPSNVFLNARKQVSARTFDLSNCEKILLDLIVNRHMGLDDRFVTKLTSHKVPGEDYAIHVTLLLKRL